jgi:thiamine biosynthesis lipoprotein
MVIADAVQFEIALIDTGRNSALINLGGNVQTVGSPEEEASPGWAIGLKKPFGTFR